MMKPNRFLDPVMHDTANKEEVQFIKVAECIQAQYEFVRKGIESFNPSDATGPQVISIPSWGKYLVPNYKVEEIKKKVKKDETI